MEDSSIGPPSTNEPKSTGASVGGQRPSEGGKSIGGQGSLPRVPTNGLPTNNEPSTIDRRRENWQTKSGWIEWTLRETKKLGRRRYPRFRRWEWNGASWVKSRPIYRADLDTMDEADYVKFAERRDRARKLKH